MATPSIVGAAPLIIPAVSLRGGHVVVVRDHAYEPVEDEGGQPFALDEFVQVFLKGYKAMLVFDIDGIEGDGPQFDEVGRLEGAGPELWWDAGAAREEDVINVITAGADRAVVTTRTLARLRDLKDCVEVTENLVFGVVARGDRVLSESRDFANAGVARAAAAARATGVEDLLLLDSGRPLGAPVDWDLVRSASQGWNRVFVGGGLEAGGARALSPPPGVPFAGAVVDLISVLSPFL